MSGPFKQYKARERAEQRRVAAATKAAGGGNYHFSTITRTVIASPSQAKQAQPKTLSNTVRNQLTAAITALQQNKLGYLANTFTGANTNANRQHAANVQAAQRKLSQIRSGWSYTTQINRK